MAHHHDSSDHQEPTANPVAIEGEENRAMSLINRVNQQLIDSGKATVLVELQHASRTANKEHFETLIDDAVYETLSSDEEFVANVSKLQSLRKAGSPDIIAEAAIITRQNELFNQYKQIIVNLAGLPDTAGRDEYDDAKKNVREVIKTHLEAGENQDDLLKKLGILELDDEGKELFTYPAQLFPSKTNQKWDLYLDRVRNHVRLARGVEMGTIDPKELESADQMRRIAHDSLTRDVHDILGFEDLSDDTWTFGATRSLIAKMRDHKYPTVETAEKSRTTHELVRAANALGLLSTRISDLHKDQ